MKEYLVTLSKEEFFETQEEVHNEFYIFEVNLSLHIQAVHDYVVIYHFWPYLSQILMDLAQI